MKQITFHCFKYQFLGFLCTNYRIFRFTIFIHIFVLNTSIGDNFFEKIMKCSLSQYFLYTFSYRRFWKIFVGFFGVNRGNMYIHKNQNRENNDYYIIIFKKVKCTHKERTKFCVIKILFDKNKKSHSIPIAFTLKVSFPIHTGVL